MFVDKVRYNKHQNAGDELQSSISIPSLFHKHAD